MVKMMMRAGVSRVGSRGRPQMRWMNIVKRVLNKRDMSVEQCSVDWLCAIEANGEFMTLNAVFTTSVVSEQVGAK